MRTNKQILLWFIVAVMLCAVISVGCGGSSSNDS